MDTGFVALSPFCKGTACLSRKAVSARGSGNIGQLPRPVAARLQSVPSGPRIPFQQAKVMIPDSRHQPGLRPRSLPPVCLSSMGKQSEFMILMPCWPWGVRVHLQEPHAQMGSVTRQPLVRGNPRFNHKPAHPPLREETHTLPLSANRPLRALEKLEGQEKNPGGKEELNLLPRVSYFLVLSLTGHFPKAPW